MEQDEESFIEVTVETLSEIPFDVSDMHDITTKQSSKTGTRKKDKNRESGRRRIRGKLKAFVKMLIGSKKIDHA